MSAAVKDLGFTPLEPIECEPWCAYGDGHVHSTMKADQVCWSADNDMELSLEESIPDRSGGRFDSTISVLAHKGFNRYPVVYLHVDVVLQRRGCPQDNSDLGIRMTASEARLLASNLLHTADLVAAPAPALAVT